MCSLAACGFPSPADDYLDRPLDFNELLIENLAATFAVRVAGESMVGAKIFPGDIAVVNRARSLSNFTYFKTEKTDQVSHLCSKAKAEVNSLRAFKGTF